MSQLPYLFDTDVCIELIRQNPVVVAHVRHHAKIPAAISAITVGELFYGARHSDDFHRAKRVNETRHFVQRVTVYSFDAVAAEKYGELKALMAKQASLIGDNDTRIGAIAIIHGLVLVTFKVRHFERLKPYGLQVEVWKR